MVSQPRGRGGVKAPEAASWFVRALRSLLPILVAASLLSGIAGGLWRLGVALPFPTRQAWLGHAALAHAALMICGFMGTLIGVERAVAVKLRAAWLAPLASALGGLCLLLGWHSPGAWLLVGAAVAFTGVNVVVVRRQRADHTLLLLLSALAWLAGNLLLALRPGSGSALPWWFAFLVMTIAAERLEMTRLMRRRPGAQVSLHAVLAALLAGAAVSVISPYWGGQLYGATMVALASWLGVFDIARRTVHAQGLPRYMAVCLLGGYAWLAVAGVAWTATAAGLPVRDLALHALGLGFVISMMMGHAPVILPAIARIKLQFSWIFYVPLAALHLSLLIRFGPGLADLSARAAGAALNALAIGLFVGTVAGAARAWSVRHGAGQRAGR